MHGNFITGFGDILRKSTGESLKQLQSKFNLQLILQTREDFQFFYLRQFYLAQNTTEKESISSFKLNSF